jgi:endonuclease/exonuclease/phosphatase family metal-dependent hydrolase
MPERDQIAVGDRDRAVQHPRVGVSDAAAEAIVKQGQINVLLRKGTYDDADRARILDLLSELGLCDSDDGNAFVMLRQNHGQLVRRHQDGTVEVVAGGRGNWLGWVEPKMEPVNEVSARVMKEIDADILAVVEAESRHSLRDFSRVLLRQVGGQPYEHTMLIEGNDDRGINVGLLTKEAFDFDALRTHIFDTFEPNRAIFSRDCPEYLVRTGATEVLVLVNHFKSKRGGGDAQRLRQATRVKEIVLKRLAEHPNLVVLGDFNDTPDSENLKPLLDGTPLKDISAHESFDDGGLPRDVRHAGRKQPHRLSPAVARPHGQGHRRRHLPQGRL